MHLLMEVMTPVVAVLILVATRPGFHRWMLAVMGGLAYGLFQYVWERGALRVGWWWYADNSVEWSAEPYLLIGAIVGTSLVLAVWRLGWSIGRVTMACGLWGLVNLWREAWLFSELDGWHNTLMLQPGLVPHLAYVAFFGVAFIVAYGVFALLGGTRQAEAA